MAETLESVIASLPQEQQEAIAQETRRLVAEEMILRQLCQARAQSQQAEELDL